jgi:uncharacterized protein YkvS
MMPFSVLKNQGKHFKGQKVGKFPEFEDELLDYVRCMHSDSVSVSHEMLHFKAQDMAKKQGITHLQFKVGRFWVCHFMKRKGLLL